MAATADELRTIYANLFHEPENPAPLRALRRALEAVNRSVPDSRGDADRVLIALNGGEDPRLTFTQLECLRLVLSQRAFAPLIPAGEPSASARPLIELYKRLFAEPDLAHLRALQRAVFEYDQLGTEPKRLAVLALLRELSPGGDWSDAHIGALDALLVRDITFKQIAPFQVTGDFW
jgi:predicted DNA-binding transcriptional regulator YafY